MVGHLQAPQVPQQLVFVVTGTAAQFGDFARGGAFHQGAVELTVMPAEFLAQLAGAGGDLLGFAAVRTQARGAEGEHFEQAAGFGFFHVTKSQGEAVVALLFGQSEAEEPFVERPFVLQEGDFEVLAEQLAAQLLETVERLPVGGECGLGLAALLFAAAEHAPGQLFERRQLEQAQAVERFAGHPPRLLGFVLVEQQGGKQDLAEQSAVGHAAVGESGVGGARRRHGFARAAGAAEQHGPVIIDQGRPQVVAFPFKDPPRASQLFERLGVLTTTAFGERGIGERLGRFVSQLEAVEQKVGALRQTGGVVGQVELEVDLGQVEVAQGLVVIVSGPYAVLARGLITPDGAGIFAAQKIQVGDVVVRLDHQTVEAFGQAIGAVLLINLERFLEMMEADVAGRDVAQANGGVLGAALAHKFLVRGAVPFEGLGPAILTGENIGEVVVEDGQAQTVAELLEPNAGLFFETVDPIQLAEVGEVGQSARTGDGSA